MGLGKIIKKTIAYALTKDDGKSAHEKLNIDIKGVKNLNCILCKTYLEALVKAVKEVHISKFRHRDSLKETREYWKPLKENIIKCASPLAAISDEMVNLNRDINNKLKEILGKNDVGKILKSVKNVKGNAKMRFEIHKIIDEINALSENIKHEESDINNIKKNSQIEFDSKYPSIKKKFEQACVGNIATIVQEIDKLEKLKSDNANTANLPKLDFSKCKTLENLEEIIGKLPDGELKNTANTALEGCKNLAEKLYP